MNMNRTQEETKQYYIERMGKELGAIFSELRNEVLMLNLKWSEFLVLFCTKKIVDLLLKKSAPSFFLIIYNIMYDDALLHIERLTEKASSREGKYKYLTIQRLHDLIWEKEEKELECVEENEKKKEVNKKIQPLTNLKNKAIKKAKFAHEWRVRRIAHKELQLALKKPEVKPLVPASSAKVRDALEAIAEYLKAISDHYDMDQMTFKIDKSQTGAYSLLYVIDDGLDKLEERDEQFMEGKGPLDKDRFWDNPLFWENCHFLKDPDLEQVIFKG
jgi:hypothetical protein